MNSFNEIESRVIEYVEPTQILQIADYNEIQKYPRITQSLVKSLAPKTFEESKPTIIRFGPIAYTVDDEDEDNSEDIINFVNENSEELKKLNELVNKNLKIKVYGNITLQNLDDSYPDLYLNGFKELDSNQILSLNVMNKPINNYINYTGDISISNPLSNMKLVHNWNDINRIESLSNLYIEFKYEGTKSTGLDNLSSIIGENTYIEIRHPKKQPPRPKDLVDKLPKIIASYIKNNKQYITEYESYYNFGNHYNEVAVENFKKFIEFIEDKKNDKH